MVEITFTVTALLRHLYRWVSLIPTCTNRDELI